MAAAEGIVSIALREVTSGSIAPKFLAKIIHYSAMKTEKDLVSTLQKYFKSICGYNTVAALRAKSSGGSVVQKLKME